MTGPGSAIDKTPMVSNILTVLPSIDRAHRSNMLRYSALKIVNLKAKLCHLISLRLFGIVNIFLVLEVDSCAKG